MPAIVVCAACRTKLKVPENSTAKALRCPKCKGAVPLAPPQKDAPPPAKPKPPPVPPVEDELEVNEAVDDKDDELEVNEAVDDDEGEGEDNDEDEEKVTAKDSALAKLGFLDVEDVFEEGDIPEEARKAIQKAFIKKEKALWAGRPDSKIIEASAWIGWVVGSIAILVGTGVCLGTSAGALLSATEIGASCSFSGLALCSS